MEEFHTSLKYLFIAQRISFLSVLKPSDFKPSSKLIITSLVFILFYCALAFSTIFLHEAPEQIRSDGQKITLTNDTHNFSSTLSILFLLLTWLSVIIFRKKESQFYQDLLKIDKILEKHGSMEVLYKKCLKGSRMLFLPFGLHLIFYSVMVKNDKTLTIDMFLPITLFGVMSIGGFMCACCFYFNIKLLRDRFCFVYNLTRHCVTMKEFEELERVHKSLITLMDTINDTMGVKVGFNLLSNFLNAVTFSYMAFVGFIDPYPNSRLVYYNIFGVILPHVTMLFITFLSGEWITTNVSVFFCPD